MHMHAHAVRRLSWPLQRAVRSDTEQATCDAGHETDAGAASCIHLSRPVTRQTITDPPDLPYPTRRCEERERSSCTLLVVVEAAGPVAGVTSDVVRLRSAVEEVAGDVLHDAHRLAAGHRLCSVGSYARTGRAARTTGDRSAVWRR
jgi:hypothetical protein